MTSGAHGAGAHTAWATAGGPAVLAQQAESAATLLDRFGAQLVRALEAVGDGDDATLDAALAERERLLAQLAPVLAPLAAARRTEAHAAQHDPRCAAALRRVDAALAHAQHLHRLVADGTRERDAAAHADAPSAWDARGAGVPHGTAPSSAHGPAGRAVGSRTAGRTSAAGASATPRLHGPVHVTLVR